MEDFQKKKKQFEKKDRELFQEVRKLQEAKADDDGDFNKVYELSKKYIQKIIRDIVKDEYATEDIMQETYLQIYNKIDTLKEPEAFYVWAGRIATNLTLRYIQKNRRELLVEADEDGNTDFAFETVGEDTENFIPEAVLMDLEKQRIIAEILDRLSVEQKLCVQYFYYEEMSVKEIAQAFGCSEGTIKSRLNYARKSIKDAVIEMDVKHGTRLYSLAALPLFLIVFRNVLEGAVVLGVGGGAAAGAIGKGVQAVSDGLSEATGGNPVVQTPPVQEPVTPSVQEPVVQAPPAQPLVTPPTQPPVTPPKAGGIVSKIMGTTAGKAAAGIVAAAVVAGSGYAAYQANQAEPEADRTNMIAIYYEIPATQFGYENPFENKNYGRFYLSAQIDGDTAAGEESIFSVIYKPDVDPDSRTPEPMDGIDGKAKEKIQYQEFQNVVEYMKSNIDYEFARNFYAENAENRMNESVPAKERFDDLQFDSETDFYVGRYTNVFYSADDIQEIQENWIKADNMFPQTQKIFIDGQEFTFTTEGSYANIGSIYEKYREDTYVEVRAAAETCSKPVVNRDIYEDGVIFANSVIVCVYGHINGEVDLSDSKYVKYKGEDGKYHFYTDRWVDATEDLPEETISSENVLKENTKQKMGAEDNLPDKTKEALANLASGMENLIDEYGFGGYSFSEINGDSLSAFIKNSMEHTSSGLHEYTLTNKEGKWGAYIYGDVVSVELLDKKYGISYSYQEDKIMVTWTEPMEENYPFTKLTFYDFLMQFGDIAWDELMNPNGSHKGDDMYVIETGGKIWLGDKNVELPIDVRGRNITGAYEIYYVDSDGRTIELLWEVFSPNEDEYGLFLWVYTPD